MTEVFNQEELELKIISGILQSEDDMLKAINKGVTPKYFTFRPENSNIAYYSRIYQIIAEFYARYNELISFESFQIGLSKKKIHNDEKIRESIISNMTKCFSRALSEDTDDMNFEYLLDDLRDRSIKREVAEYIPQLKESFREKTATVALDEFIDKLTDIKTTKANVGQQTLTIDVAGSADSILGLYEEEKAKFDREGGVMIGLPEIDGATNGFREGQFIVILGELGKGKSTVLLNWAVGAHQSNKNVLFFSFEMPRYQCMARYMAIKTERVYEKFKNFSLQNEEFEDWKKFLIEEEEKNECYFEFVDQPDNRTVEEVDSRIRKYIAADRKPDVIFVDYLGNMALTESARGMKDYEVVAQATVRLRQLARRYRIPVITAQQINREGLKNIRKKEENNEHDKIMWSPESVQDSKKTMDYADFVIGINPKNDKEDPSGLQYMWFHKVKARDAHFEPFCTLFVPEMAKIIPINKSSNAMKHLFDRSDLTGQDIFVPLNSMGSSLPVDFDDEDDIGEL